MSFRAEDIDEDPNELPDRLFDLEINTDRDIVVDYDGDLKLTRGEHTLEQVAAIRTGHVVRQLLGSTRDGTKKEKARADIERILKNDPRIEGVSRVELTDVESNDNAIDVEIYIDEEESFEIELPA